MSDNMKNEYDFSTAKRGPVVPVESGKTRITIRLDNSVLDWFREKAHQAGGASYQGLINEALARHAVATQEPLDMVGESSRSL